MLGEELAWGKQVFQEWWSTSLVSGEVSCSSYVLCWSCVSLTACRQMFIFLLNGCFERLSLAMHKSCMWCTWWVWVRRMEASSACHFAACLHSFPLVTLHPGKDLGARHISCSIDCALTNTRTWAVYMFFLDKHHDTVLIVYGVARSVGFCTKRCNTP